MPIHYLSLPYLTSPPSFLYITSLPFSFFSSNFLSFLSPSLPPLSYHPVIPYLPPFPPFPPALLPTSNFLEVGAPCMGVSPLYKVPAKTDEGEEDKYDSGEKLIDLNAHATSLR